jgi:hypothetical protein
VHSRDDEQSCTQKKMSNLLLEKFFMRVLLL